MKSSFIFLVLLSSYCYCDRLLGGWSQSNDDSFKNDCLHRALIHLHGDKVNHEMKSEVSDLSCKTQIVNGLNIKCIFVLRGQRWQCSYYKSFIQTLDTQLEECKQIEDEQKQEPNENERKPEEKDDEEPVEEQGKADEGDKEEQALKENKKEEGEQQPAGEKEDQAVQEPQISNEDEDDDEAKVDAMNNQMLKQNAHNEEEQQQQQQQQP